jgi:hypothetical protein
VSPRQADNFPASVWKPSSTIRAGKLVLATTSASRAAAPTISSAVCRWSSARTTNTTCSKFGEGHDPKQIFTRSHFQRLDAFECQFRELIEQWVVEYAELFAANG